MIKNPKYKGKWSPPLIKNPLFKHKWEPKMILNPKFTHDHNYSLPGITGFSFNIWSVWHDVLVTNLLVSHNETLVKRWNLEDFAQRQRFLIKKMKIAYDWINIDEELEIPPEPGMMNKIVYYSKRFQKYYDSIEYKPVYYTILLAFLFIGIPFLYILYEILFGTVDHLKLE